MVDSRVQDTLRNDESGEAMPKMRRYRLAAVSQTQNYALVLAWIVMIAVFAGVVGSSFFSVQNFTSSIFGAQSVLVILAFSPVITLTAGEFDLSIGGNLGMTAMIVAVLNVHEGWPIGPAIVVALAASAALGFINGFVVIRLGVESIITTLGTGTVAAGIVLWLSSSETISGISSGLVSAVIVPRLGGLPLGFFYALALTVIVWAGLRYTRLGRRILFVGRNRTVSRLTGLHVARLRWGALTAGGFVAGLAGLVYAGTSGAASPGAGTSFMLPAIAAVFLGSTAISPGRFNAWGTLIAVYFLSTGVNGLSLLGISVFVQDLFYGLALIVGVAISVAIRKRDPIISLDLLFDSG
jgi:ribose transport system permease protein